MIDKELVVKRSVTPGLGSVNEGWTELRDGAVAGERVVVGRMDTLKAGDRVVLKDEPATRAASTGGTSAGG